MPFFFNSVKRRERAPLLSSALHTQPVRVVYLPWPIVVSHFGEVNPLNLLASQIFPLAGRFSHFGQVVYTRPAAAALILIASDSEYSLPALLLRHYEFGDAGPGKNLQGTHASSLSSTPIPLFHPYTFLCLLSTVYLHRILDNTRSGKDMLARKSVLQAFLSISHPRTHAPLSIFQRPFVTQNQSMYLPDTPAVEGVNNKDAFARKNVLQAFFSIANGEECETTERYMRNYALVECETTERYMRSHASWFLH